MSDADNKKHTERAAARVLEAARALGMCRSHGVLIEKKLLNPTDAKPAVYGIQYVLPCRTDLKGYGEVLRTNLDHAIDQWLREAIVQATEQVE